MNVGRDLEDVLSENLAHKKTVQAQKVSLKVLATKLLKIKQEIKKKGQKGEYESTDLVEDLKEQIKIMHKRNEALEHKITFLSKPEPPGK